MIHPLRRLAASLTLACLANASLSAQDGAPSPVPSRPLSAQASAGEVPPPSPQELTLPAAVPELTLQECIARALSKNFDLEIGRFGPQLAQDSIIVASGGYETQLTLTGSTGENTNPGISSKNSDLRAGVSKRLYSGTTVSASSRLDRNSTNPALIGLNPAYDADLTLSVRQSLLSGFGTAVNRAVVERAEIGLQRANLDFKGQLLNVIQDTENAYYILTAARQLLVVRNFSLALANKLFDEAKTRRDTGVATDLDVLQAEVGVANARRGVILAEQTAQDRQDALLALIGQFELNAPVGPVRFGEMSEAVPVFASSYQMAKQNQPDYLSSLAAIDQYKLDLRLAQDAARPELTVGAALGMSGTNGSGSDAFNDALDRQSHSWQVDFALSYPWGQKSDKARERQSLATLSREQTRLRLIEQTIEVQVRSAVRSVDANLESVKIATQASHLSQRQYELEKAKFDAGLSTSRRVLEAQDDLESARVAELQAKVTLHTAVAALHRLEGSSLQRYAVVLP